METVVKRKSTASDILLLAVAAIWGGGFVAGKMALTSFSAVNILMFRFLGAAAVFGVVFAKRIAACSHDEIKHGIIIGVIQFSALLMQTVGLKYTTPAKQSFLASAYVVLTPFTAWAFIKARPSKKDIAAAVTALAGLALISLNGKTSGIQIGDILTLGFALLFSVQIVYIGRNLDGCDVMAVTFWQFLTAGLLALAASAVTGFDTSRLTAAGIAGVAYLAFINTDLAMGLQNFAQRFTDESRAALLLSFESVFGFVFSVLVYREAVSLKMLTGCAIMFAAVLISKSKI
ncbi:MAG: DMT family transporter [Clostridia bacterium]|nr:DMT family transporter [Clostridia bacterium]